MLLQFNRQELFSLSEILTDVKYCINYPKQYDNKKRILRLQLCA